MSDKHIKYPKGLRLTPDECKFVEGCLLGVAETAKSQNDPKMFNISMGIAQRVSQAEMAGDGVPPQLHTQLQEGLQRALQSGKPELAQRAMENFLATMVRLHPDPARAMSLFVVNYVSQTVAEATMMAQAPAQIKGALQILERFKIKLQALNRSYNEDDAWPEAKDLLEYLTKWTGSGITSVEAGKEPWEKDVALQEDLAEQARQESAEGGEG